MIGGFIVVGIIFQSVWVPVLFFLFSLYVLTFNCPKCGCSIYFNGWVYKPFPNKVCPNCKLDLTEPYSKTTN